MSENSFQNPEEMAEIEGEIPTKRLPVALCLDTSGSMSTGGAIDELNKAVATFFTELKNDPQTEDSVETVVIKFGGDVSVVSPFDLVCNAQIPTFRADGGTPMGEALTKSIDLLLDRKEGYKSSGLRYSQPILVVMTDGEPTDSCEKPTKMIQELTSNKSLTVIPICFGEGSNLKKMKEITGSSPILFTETTEFIEFFKWLSSSCSAGTAMTPEQFKKDRQLD